jgi:Protein of unknown function (DUF998)
MQSSMASPSIRESDAGSSVSIKALVLCGVLAGPIYVIVGGAQAMLREGFDPRRHALSLLSNGSLGWIQIANFPITGSLVLAGSVGLKRVLVSGPGRTWGPLLLGIYGLGLVGAAFFSADPAHGFPPGTPPGQPRTVSTQGLLHFVCGGVGFLGLIAACLVFARRFAFLKEAGWAWFSALTGIIFLAAFFGIASGSAGAAIILSFYAAVFLAWAWITALALRTLKEYTG